MTHALEFGSLDLTGGYSDEGYELHVLADGMDTGSPEAKVRQIVTALADGDLVTYDRAGNRVVTFDVEITAEDGLALAEGEAALRREMFRPNTITWTPPSDFAPPTVFDVLTSEGSHSFNDLDEIHSRRIFKVSLTCAPHARSATLTTAAALAAGTSTITVDDCSSLTGWTAGTSTPPDVVSQSGGAVWAYDATGGNDSMALRRAAPIDMSDHSLFILEWKSHPGSGFTLLGLSAAADPYPSELHRVALADGWMRSTWQVEPGDLANGFQFAYLNADSVTKEGDYIGIREVLQSDVPPGATPNQLSRILPVGGTERTPASILVSAPNGVTATGLTLVHTCPEDGSGYSPPLQPWRSQGQAQTLFANSFSGHYETINTTSWHADVPTSSLPSGGYAFMARLASQAAGPVTITWSTSTIFPGSAIQNGLVSGTVLHTFATANEWELVPIALLSLPSVRTTAGHVQFALRVDAASPIVTLDEAWAFRVDDDCALTILNNITANLWLDSPSTASPVSTVWVGDSEDERRHPGRNLYTPGANHILHPDGTAVFTATQGVAYPEVSASFHKRWHSNAAE